MNELAVSFGWLALQVTAIAIVAWLLESRLARRCPAAAGRLLVAAFVAIGLLTIAGLGPLPDWWAWQPPRGTQPGASEVASTPTEPASPQADAATPGRWFRINLPTMVPESVSDRDLAGRAGRLLAAIWLAGAALALLRLCLGLVRVQSIRRRCEPVVDPQVLDALASLRARMGCKRPVEIRVAELPGLPATAGWLRPMILLPLDWRVWNESQLQAALAHELAHIKSADYLAGVLAQLGLATHFYHPLMRRLWGRLQLRQELAADALAARHAGGPHDYLRALAVLALRSQGRRPDVPARLFLSAHGGAWFRRVEMLRNAKEARPVSRTVRGLALAVLVCSVAVVSAMRGPAQSPTPAATPPAIENNLEPFDLSYFSPENAPHSHALVAIRPSVVFTLPGMENVRKQYELGLAEIVKAQGGSLPNGFSLADIDQIVAEVGFESKGTGEPGSRSIMIGSDCFMIRMKKDMDWGKFLKTVFVNVDSKSAGAGMFYTIKIAALPGPMTLYAPDNRTLVPAKEKDGKPVVPAKAKAPDLGPAWKQVERAHFAYFYDNRDHWWTEKLAPELKMLDPAAKLVGAAESASLGAWFTDGIRAKLSIQGKTDADAKLCQESMEAIRKLARKTPATKSDEDEPIFKLGKALLRKAAGFDRDGAMLKAEASVSVRLADLLNKMEAKAEATAK